MKSLQDYQKLNYKMEIEFNPEEKAYFVTFPELPGCMADGNSPNEAIKEAIKAKNKWLEIAIQTGWTVPEPTPKIETSGRLTTRLPKYLHKKLIIRAEQEGVSQNQLIATYIAEGLERSIITDTVKQFEKKADSVMKKIESSIAVNYVGMAVPTRRSDISMTTNRPDYAGQFDDIISANKESNSTDAYHRPYNA
jgi:antitoxin HicB